MRLDRIAAVAVAALLAFTGVGCGHYHHSDVYVTTTQPGTYEPFTLTVQNNTNMVLLPGPVVAEPYEPNVPTVQVAPGGTATYYIGFLPSSITVGAVGVGSFSSFTYPTTTLYLGVDYFWDSNGATFVYR